MATEGIDLVIAALRDSERVDDSRIEVTQNGSAVTLSGAVSSAEEATWAATLAAEYSDQVINQLRVDRLLREGVETPLPTEQVSPAADEVLVGGTDMLAGPDTQITSDVTEALEENIPWDPPSEPSLAPTQAEYGGEVSFGDGSAPDGGRSTIDEDGQFAAPDLSREDLATAADGGPVPSLDPETVRAGDDSEREPLAQDALGATPPEKLEPWPERVPGASAGVGAIGETEQEGGSLGGQPVTE
jgi:hypothetical protein